MNGIKKVNIALIFVALFIPYSYTQQQQHIPWPSLADSPWPIGRGDAQATGRSKYIGPRTANVIWRKDMPLGIIRGPVVGYNDDLFVGTCAVNASAGENYFYSIDKNGEDIWTYVTQGNRPLEGGSTIESNGSIYIVAGSVNGLIALNPDGTLKWKNSRFSSGSFSHILSIAKNHNIYIVWRYYIYILETDNGNIIDSIQTLQTAYKTDLVFSVDGDTFFYLTGDANSPGAINAVNIDGELVWTHYSFIINLGTPVVDNANRVYVYGAESYTERFLYCFNPDGTVNWKFQLDATTYPYEYFENFSSPTIDRNGNIIFQASTQDSGYIYSVNYYGNLNWKTTLGHYGNDGAIINHGLVCDAEGKIYCGSSYGFSTNFWCLDSDGTILWKLDLEGYEYDTSPAIGSDGTLYIGTHKSSLYQNHVRNLIAVRDTVTSVENNINGDFSYKLEQNYPNPFNSTTHIRFTIPESDRIILRVYDLLGSEVSTLLDRYLERGEYDVIFRPDNLPSGIYFYTLTSGNFTSTKKLILLK
jgi:hypothetical protein